MPPGPAPTHRLDRSATDAHAAGDVVDPHDAAAVGDAVGHGGQRRVAAVVDVEAEQLAEEALVRCREQQRVAEVGERVALAQQHGAHGRRLAEVEPGVDRDLVGGEPGIFRLCGPVQQERATSATRSS